jgi:hypothetical protein
VYEIAAVWVADAVVLHTALAVFFGCSPFQIGTATIAATSARTSSRMGPVLGRERRCGDRGPLAGRRAVLVVLIVISVADKAVLRPIGRVRVHRRLGNRLLFALFLWK